MTNTDMVAKPVMIDGEWWTLWHDAGHPRWRWGKSKAHAERFAAWVNHEKSVLGWFTDDFTEPAGRVYFVLGNGAIKIGHAHGVSARMASLANQCEFPIELLGSRAGWRFDETSYHRDFAYLRHTRFAGVSEYGGASEWFTPGSALVLDILRNAVLHVSPTRIKRLTYIAAERFAS